MKLLRFVTLLVFVFSIAFLTSCEKEGLGGKNTLHIFVKHHETPIPDAVVYIKYGEKEFPGAESKNYDQNVNCDSRGEAKIENLKKGQYYIYSVGLDKNINEEVSGGIPVEIRQKSGVLSIELPVTEHH